MENKNVFNSFLNCTRFPLSRIFLGSLFHRVGPAQANARRPKRFRFLTPPLSYLSYKHVTLFIYYITLWRVLTKWAARKINWVTPLKNIYSQNYSTLIMAGVEITNGEKKPWSSQSRKHMIEYVVVLKLAVYLNFPIWCFWN